MYKKKRMSGEERKKQIVNVAMKVFSEKGFQGTKTKDLARAAGVSEAAIFKLFKSKNDIYSSIIKKINCEIKGHSKEIADMKFEVDNFQKFLEEHFLHVIENTEKDNTYIRFMLYSSLEESKFVDNLADTHLLGEREAITKHIKNGIEDGDYRKVNPEFAARTIQYMLNGYCIEQFALRKNEHLNKNEALRTMMDILFNGIRKQTKEKT